MEPTKYDTSGKDWHLHPGGHHPAILFHDHPHTVLPHRHWLDAGDSQPDANVEAVAIFGWSQHLDYVAWDD